MPIFGRAKWPDTLTLEGDSNIDIRVRVHPRARNYRLSISSAGEPVLSVPPKGKLSDAKGFLQRQHNWLRVRLKRRAPPIAFIEGAKVPLRDKEHLIVGTGKIRGQVEIRQVEDELQLLVPGGPDHLGRRLTDWLKKQALAELEPYSDYHAKRLGVNVTSVTIRSQSTRWGSCSSAGRLNYNWRLILAPTFVLDYVAAHEVAHLCEMNHSPAFWAKVQETLPDMDKGRSWLKAHGNRLMGYGVTPL